MRNLDTSLELLFRRWKNGVQLIRPTKESYLPLPSLKDILSLPCNVHLVNTASVLQNLNEATAENCHWASLQDALGSTAYSVFKEHSAQAIIAHDRDVMLNNKTVIREEEMFLLDGDTFKDINIKTPWYDEDNKIIGVVGFTIIIPAASRQNIETAMHKLIEWDILSQQASANINNLLYILETKGIILTTKEMTIIKWLIRGKTNKQIAAILTLSPRTIEQYVDRLKSKLNVYSRPELIEKIIDSLGIFSF